MSSTKKIVTKAGKALSPKAKKAPATESPRKIRLSAAEFRKREDARREQLSAKRKQERAEISAARQESRRAAAEELRNNPPKKKRSGFSLFMHELTYGVLKPKVTCPHCQEMGTVRVKRRRQKVGVSGGKLTGAILTGGLSILATGLSRKETVTEAYCDNCTVQWQL